MVEDADTSEAEKLDKLHFEVVPFSLGIGRNQTSHWMEEASGWLSGAGVYILHFSPQDENFYLKI